MEKTNGTTETKKRREVPDELKAKLSLLVDRMKASREELGALDFQKSILEQQCAEFRAKLAADAQEVERLVKQETARQGLDREPGWAFHMRERAFLRSS